MVIRSLVAALLILVVPISDIRVTRWLKRSADPAKKVKAYAGISIFLWLTSRVVWIAERPGMAYAMRAEDVVKGLRGNAFIYGVCVPGLK
jgi:hypothetical protein